jgi:hypothetical protein
MRDARCGNKRGGWDTVMHARMFFIPVFRQKVQYRGAGA